MQQTDNTGDERGARLARAAELAPYHPALRWTVDDDATAAHSRRGVDLTACGKVGVLRLADPDLPLCTSCYPWSPAPPG